MPARSPLYKLFSPQVFNLVCCLALLLLSMGINTEPASWVNFADPYDYLNQSKLSLLDPAFYFPPKPAFGAARPFTVPLFYKLAGGETFPIIQLQRVMHALASFYFVSALLLWVKRTWQQFAWVVVLHVFFSWWNILGWTVVLLSESLSVSLGILWLASLLHYVYKPAKGVLLLHALLALLFSFTRDNWPYILTLFYLLAASFAWRRNKKQAGVFAGLTLLAVAFSLVQMASAKRGLRYSVPLYNTFVTRILPQPDYYAWYIKEGMPANKVLFERYYGINTLNDSSRNRLYGFFTDSSCADVKGWLDVHGQGTYLKFLATHPAYALLKDEPKENLKAFSSCNLYFYTDRPRGFSQRLDAYFPILPYWLVMGLALCCGWLGLRDKRLHLFIPLILALCTLMNGWLSYQADALEPERHLLMTNILMHVAGLLALAFLQNVVADKQSTGTAENIP